MPKICKNLLRFGRSSRTAFFSYSILILFAVVAVFAPSVQAGTYVRIETVLGDIDVELFDNITPLTVANFLNYVDNTDYDNSYIHRSIPGFMVQGGRFNFVSGEIGNVPKYSPVVNEFNLSNKFGTIAMAKLPSKPNSATNEWFINLADNSDNLDNQNGGFTVFGRVVGDGMEVVGKIAAVDIWNIGGVYATLPLIDYPGGPPTEEYFVLMTRISRIHRPISLFDLAEHWLDSGCDDSARDETDWCDGTDLSKEGWVNFTDFALFADTWLMENSIPNEANFNFDDEVNMIDFAIFSAAWDGVDGQTALEERVKYNGACDLHSDGVIDEQDLIVFAEHWLDGG
jgi:cyclophilin family peptidyl-prolyl cis-trans isomerase